MHGCCRQREWNTQKLIKKWHQCDTYRWWLSKQHILLISFAPYSCVCMCIFSVSFHFTMSEDDAWCVAIDTESNASAYIYNALHVNRLWHPKSKKKLLERYRTHTPTHTWRTTLKNVNFDRSNFNYGIFYVNWFQSPSWWCVFVCGLIH